MILIWGGFSYVGWQEFIAGRDIPLAHYGLAALTLLFGTAILLSVFRAYPVHHAPPSSDGGYIGYREVQEDREDGPDYTGPGGVL